MIFVPSIGGPARRRDPVRRDGVSRTAIADQLNMFNEWLIVNLSA
jgi:hypothetical protein